MTANPLNHASDRALNHLTPPAYRRLNAVSSPPRLALSLMAVVRPVDEVQDEVWD